jgi:hypothetical protein
MYRRAEEYRLEIRRTSNRTVGSNLTPSARYKRLADVVDLQGHDPIRSIQTTTNRANDVHLDANGSALAVAGDDGKIQLFW